MTRRITRPVKLTATLLAFLVGACGPTPPPGPDADASASHPHEPPPAGCRPACPDARPLPPDGAP